MPRGGARIGAGCKPKDPNNPKSAYLNIRISQADKDRIYELAKKQNKSVGEFVTEKCLSE